MEKIKQALERAVVLHRTGSYGRMRDEIDEALNTLSELEGSASGNRDHISFAETAKDAHPELSEIIAFYIQEGRVATLTGLNEFYQRAKKLEGSKTKELTDEEIGLWLIGLKKPDGTTLLGKLTGEELFALRDHIRDHGYLSPQPKEPPRYVMSRDYDALYELLCKGGEAFAYVDMNWRDGDVSRDPARVRMLDDAPIQIGVRGTCYGEVRSYDIKKHGSEKAAFLAECVRLNLEWVSVQQPFDFDAVDNLLFHCAELLPYACNDEPEKPWNTGVNETIERVHDMRTLLGKMPGVNSEG